MGFFHRANGLRRFEQKNIVPLRDGKGNKAGGKRIRPKGTGS